MVLYRLHEIRAAIVALFVVYRSHGIRAALVTLFVVYRSCGIMVVLFSNQLNRFNHLVHLFSNDSESIAGC